MAIATPDYMSPEQLSGKELDARSDLYSAGVVLFECLTRRLPFEAATTYAVIAKQLEGAPPDPRTLNQDVPEALAQVILRDRKSTRLNSSHLVISYAVFCLKKKKETSQKNYI